MKTILTLATASLLTACGAVENAAPANLDARTEAPKAEPSNPEVTTTTASQVARTEAVPDASLARLVADASALPACDEASEGSLVYVRADGMFRVCEAGAWESLDLRGKDGRNGTNGKDGAQGIAGRDGVDGKDGAQGAQGIQGVAGRDGRDGVDGQDGEGAKTAYRLHCPLRWIDGNTKGFELEFHRFTNGEGFLRIFVRHGSDAPLAFSDHLAADEMDPAAGVTFRVERYYDWNAPVMGIATSTFEYLPATGEVRVHTVDPNGSSNPYLRTISISSNAAPSCTRTEY